MAGIEVMPSRNKAAGEGNGEWLQWSINRNLLAGARFTAMGHAVTVERIIETLPDCNIAFVSVADDAENAPPLRFTGEFTYETRSADNAFRGPRAR